MKIHFFLLLFLSCLVKSWSQGNQLIQISGLVLTDIDSEPKPLPFAEISIIGTGRGVYADSKGFFSMAVQKNDTLVFNYLGFKPIFYIVPDSLGKSHYTIFQIMTRDTIYLPETIVYPWPDKNYFKQEFLAITRGRRTLPGSTPSRPGARVGRRTSPRAPRSAPRKGRCGTPSATSVQSPAQSALSQM